MSRKYPKRVRKEFARKLKAAEAFTDRWMTTGLAYSLISDYDCTLTCGEAETMADLFRIFQYPDTAEQILSDHGEDCDTRHYHEKRGAWTFTFQVKASGWKVGDEFPEYTVVANGADGGEAEARAEKQLRKLLVPEHKHYFWTELLEAETGIPSSTALYSWIDAREYGKAA
ncbi:hypothetical protein ACFTUC_17360 [Streptomyces sp. NPDC056944]|uniref:hypothetical protein n=1 Tax=Streptomyces sp. NPDC056944 TaxID=3345972 RepID=UPI00362F8899